VFEEEKWSRKTKKMELKLLNEMINRYVRPTSFPIALKLCRSEDELPNKARVPMRDMGYPIT
jgi:hypothetical protein